jgi:hypothetical protein
MQLENFWSELPNYVQTFLICDVLHVRYILSGFVLYVGTVASQYNWQKCKLMQSGMATLIKIVKQGETWGNPYCTDYPS